MSSHLAEKVEQAQENLEALEAYLDVLERVEDAIHEAQSEHPDIDGVDLPYPCTSEIEECISEAEEQKTRIEEVLEAVDNL